MNGESAASGAGVPSESTGSEGIAYFVLVNGAERGPLTARQVREWIDAGKVSTEALCWTTTNAERFPVSDILDLLPAAQSEGIPVTAGSLQRQPGTPTGPAHRRGLWREGIWLGLTGIGVLLALAIPWMTGGLPMNGEALPISIPLYPVPLVTSLLSKQLANTMAWLQFPLYAVILGVGARCGKTLLSLGLLILLHLTTIAGFFAFLQAIR